MNRIYTRQTMVRLTPEQVRVLQEAADREGLHLSTYFRHVLTKHVDTLAKSGYNTNVTAPSLAED